MYSAKIDGEPTTFGTSGMLYQSNKLMYDRTTDSLWNQFTGEPIAGPLASSGIQLDFFPSVLTTWEEWLAEHPGYDRLEHRDRGLRAEQVRARVGAVRYLLRLLRFPDTMFPVFNRDETLRAKETVIGLGIEGDYKAYPVSAFAEEPVINDVVGGREIASSDRAPGGPAGSTRGTADVYGGRRRTARRRRRSVDRQRRSPDPGERE